MSVLRLILGDQLTHDIAALQDADKESDIILMVEVMEEAIYVKHLHGERSGKRYGIK